LTQESREIELEEQSFRSAKKQKHRVGQSVASGALQEISSDIQEISSDIQEISSISSDIQEITSDIQEITDDS
jgi:methyl-accepting chemotaxis protein